MYQRICGQLRALKDIYGRLLALAEEKQPVLQANKNPEALRALTEREEALVAQAAQAERSRMAMVAELAQTWGVPPEGLTVTELARRAGGEAGAALLAEGQALVALLRELQGQNQMNRQLLEMNLSFAAFMLDTLAWEQNPSSIYGASGGAMEEGLESRRILDSEV